MPVLAWDPIARKPAWTVSEDFPAWSGALVTAGGVVFYGTMDGFFKAVDAKTGAPLWSVKLPSGVIGQPITYRGPDGVQYVAVLSGVGGWAGQIVSLGLDPRSVGGRAVRVLRRKVRARANSLAVVAPRMWTAVACTHLARCPGTWRARVAGMAVFETSRASGAPAPVELDGVKVLLIVRDAAAVDRVGRLLRASGAVLLPAFSAQDALTRLRVERPDVIACELDLPDCHGLHLMRRVRMRARAEGGATPAIALSGAFSPEAHTRAMLVGYQGVVPLACNALELSLAILEAIGGRKRRRPN